MKFKRILSVFIASCISVSMFTTVASAASVEGAVSDPAFPTATVTELTGEDIPTNVPLFAYDDQGELQPTGEKVDKLGSAFTFVADPVSDETYDFYKDWRCDYVVTFDKDIPAGTFGLYGKYGNYEIAFVYPNAITAGESINLVESAGLDSSLTYADVKDVVQSFTCGAFNLDNGNAAKEMTVDLVVWQDGQQDTTSAQLAEQTYDFQDTAQIIPPAVPTATVTELTGEDIPTNVPLFAYDDQGELQPTGEKVDKLGSAFTFVADPVSDETYNYYKDWRCDYVVSFDQDIPAGTFGLYGKYGNYDIAFVYPNAITAGESINLVESAGLDSSLTYADVNDVVQSFTCGAFNLDGANEDATMTVKLAIWKDGEPESVQNLKEKTYGYDDIATIIRPDQPKAIVTKTDPVANAPVYVMDDITDPASIETGSVAEIQEVYIFDVDPEESAVTSDYYKDYLCNFKVTANLDLRANTFGLYVSYGDYDIAFVYPNDVRVGESIFLLDLLNVGDLPYKDIKTLVQQFKFGAFNLSEENQNRGKEMYVDLVMWEPDADPADEANLLTAAHEKYDFGDLTVINVTIAASAKDASGNPVAATVSGGGDFTVGTEVTLTANDASGYTFDGWYLNGVNGTKVSDNAVYTFTAAENAEYVAVYTATAGTGVDLTVQGDSFTIAFDSYDPSTGYSIQNYKKPVGTAVELEYKGDDEFLYWVNSSYNIVSTEKSYKFILVSDTELFAVSAGYSQAKPSAYVVFKNAYDQVVLQGRYYEDDIEFPASPAKMGCTFDCWKIEGTETEIRNPSDLLSSLSAEDNVILTLVPVYTTSDKTYTVRVYVKDGENTSKVGDDIVTPVGEITVVSKQFIQSKTGDTYDAGFFSIDGGNTAVAYGDQYTAISAVPTKIEVTFVVGESDPEALVVIPQMYATPNGNKYRVSTTMKYYVPDSFSVYEAGFVYSSVTVEPGMLTLENVGSNNGVKKHVSGFTDKSGIYTMNINTSDPAKQYNIVAYVTYMDGSNITTIYSDVKSGSYNSLV